MDLVDHLVYPKSQSQFLDHGMALHFIISRDFCKNSQGGICRPTFRLEVRVWKLNGYCFVHHDRRASETKCREIRRWQGTE